MTATAVGSSGVPPEIVLALSALLLGQTTDSAMEIINQASNLIEREGGFVPFVRNAGLGGIAMAIFVEIINGIQSVGTVLLGPPRALGRGLILLVDETIFGLVDVFGAGTETTVRSFTSGTASLLGPFAQPASIGVVMISLAIFVWVINRQNITPLSFVRSVSPF